MSTFADTNEAVSSLLKNRDPADILKWARETKGSLSLLSSFIYDKDDLFAWRAVECLGIAAGLKAGENMEAVRNIIRRLFWSMSDESGSVGWHAGEAIGEILYQVPSLLREYGRILASYHGKEPFREGVFWAMTRITGQAPRIFEDVEDVLTCALADNNPFIRACAAIVLLRMHPDSARQKINSLLDDNSEIKIYDFQSGDFISDTVSGLLRKIY